MIENRRRRLLNSGGLEKTINPNRKIFEARKRETAALARIPVRRERESIVAESFVEVAQEAQEFMMRPTQIKFDVLPYPLENGGCQGTS